MTRIGTGRWTCGRPVFGGPPVSPRRLYRRAQVQCANQAGGTRETAPLLLEGVRVVLVSPKTPANIGAVLRAAENFEAHDVCVVDPRCDPRCGEVEKVSCGSQVFSSMRVEATLQGALADVTSSVGFTRRAGAGRVTHPSLSHLLAHFPAILPPLPAPAGTTAGSTSSGGGGAESVLSGGGGSSSRAPGAGSSGSSSSSGGGGSGEAGGGGRGRLALVFGREESGLLESELLLCSHACSIPTGRSQPSLNLSHAVAVVLAQLFESRAQQLGGPDLFEEERARFVRRQALAPVDQGELEALLARWAALLESAGISSADSTGGGDRGNHGRRRQAMGHIRSLLLRGRATTAEVRALHGLCKELESRLQQ